MSRSERTDAEWARLCEDVGGFVPWEVGGEAWYLVIAAALITSPSPHLLGSFSRYLTQRDLRFAAGEARSRLSLRFRDVCLKLITLVGAPQVLSALMPLAKAEGEGEGEEGGKKDGEGELNPKWTQLDVQKIHARGSETIQTIYGPSLLPKIFSTWGPHSPDFQFAELFTVYGLYLSDFEYLTALETEAVVFATICCTGLRGPSLWHMRGMGRLLGARGDDDENETVRRVKEMLRRFKQGIIAVVEFEGEEFIRRARLGDWCNVGDVVRELGGWGDDE